MSHQTHVGRVVTIALALLCASRAAVSQDDSRSVNDRVKTLERDVKSLKGNVSALNDLLPLSIVWLDCDTHRFTWLKLENGLSFAAICDDVEPYLDGHKVHVKIGNPYAASFGGFSGTLWYGPTPLARQRAAMPLPGVVAPGQWNSVVVTINASKPADMRSLGIEIDVNTVGLRDP